MDSPIKTRVFIISDTHGLQLKKLPLAAGGIDVVIHCGDLTEHSKLSEFQETIRLLQKIEAPLKLVIPGNHDFSLDENTFRRKIAEAQRVSDDSHGLTDLLLKEYGTMGAAQALWKDVRSASSGEIILLDEGEHDFQLRNGAHLKVYASPYTPSTDEWGFQYSSTRDFEIGDDVDIAITHGPPRGIMDMTADKRRIGCPMLFRAIAKAKPLLHCFGHAHHGWGAKLVSWRPEIPDEASHFNSIDNDSSQVIESLPRLRGSKFETEEDAELRKERIAQ